MLCCKSSKKGEVAINCVATQFIAGNFGVHKFGPYVVDCQQSVGGWEMVSFSCDDCQNVFTRKRIDGHFYRCRTRSVSCIDCGCVFDASSVKRHTSCITEAEKYEGGGVGVCSTDPNKYCTICKLQLPGLVAAAQHYNSKKHKKNECAAAAAVKAAAAATVTVSVAKKEIEKHAAEAEAEEAKECGGRVSSKAVKKVMKTILKKQPKRRMKLKSLITAVITDGVRNGHKCSETAIDLKVRELVDKSRRFNNLVEDSVELISR